MEQKDKQFKPQSKEYEVSLIKTNDSDVKKMKEYVITLIKSALGHFLMSKETYNKLYKEMMSDILVAAERFLKSGGQDKDYKFSTYYSWYISQRIEQTDDKIIRVKK